MMVDAKLFSYMKTELSKGFSVDQIKKKLISSGWNVDDVELAVLDAKSQPINNFQQTFQKSDNQSSKLWLLLASGITFVAVGLLTMIILIAKGV